ncbi:MAG TPA: hypothetical protein VEA80_13895 [Vitreimonas sp.]|uniref:hypothetical protein n=1 Tax=Vitreimonas sp. TaxID=3069702 RepID=UPI002D35DF94|nr:hypothetical protein [Vitreimonas sp.]HYD88561.1 hypothetical protein [Vitreimonas sp.]
MGAAKRSKAGRGTAAPSFSTSEGRANLARALETTDQEKTVVGFARYNTPIAALVPIEAVRMLAGQEGEIEPAVRAKIVRMARLFLASDQPVRRPRRAAASKKAPAKTARAKKAGRKAKTKPRAKRKGLSKSA